MFDFVRRTLCGGIRSFWLYTAGSFCDAFWLLCCPTIRFVGQTEKGPLHRRMKYGAAGQWDMAKTEGRRF